MHETDRRVLELMRGEAKATQKDKAIIKGMRLIGVRVADIDDVEDGGAGSGNFNHSGRPGQIGGSGGGGGGSGGASGSGGKSGGSKSSGNPFSGKSEPEARKMIESYSKAMTEATERAKQAETAYKSDIKKWIKNDTKNMSAQQYNRLILENGGDPSSPFREDSLTEWAKEKHPAETERHEKRIKELQKSAKESGDVVSRMLEGYKQEYSNNPKNEPKKVGKYGSPDGGYLGKARSLVPKESNEPIPNKSENIRLAVNNSISGGFPIYEVNGDGDVLEIKPSNRGYSQRMLLNGEWTDHGDVMDYISNKMQNGSCFFM